MQYNSLIKLTLVFLIFSLLSCENKKSNKNSNLVEIDIDTNQKINDSLRFNNLINNFSYLELKGIPFTEYLVSYDKVIEYEDRFYILDKKKSNIMVFDKFGDYVSNIGKRGGGPGEYEAIFDFDINKKTGEIILLDNQIEILFFNTENEFIRSLKIKDFFPDTISFLDSNLIACSLGHIEPGGEAVKIISKESGEIIESLCEYPSDYRDYKSFAFSGGFTKVDDKTYYTYKSSSKINVINDDNSIEELYKFNFGNSTWPENKIFDLEGFDAATKRFDVSILTNKFCINKGTIFFEYLDKRKIKNAIYFTKERSIYTPNNEDSRILRFFSVPVGIDSKNRNISGLLFEKYESHKSRDSSFIQNLTKIDSTFTKSLNKMNYNNNAILIFYDLTLNYE